MRFFKYFNDRSRSLRDKDFINAKKRNQCNDNNFEKWFSDLHVNHTICTHDVSCNNSGIIFNKDLIFFVSLQNHVFFIDVQRFGFAFNHSRTNDIRLKIGMESFLITTHIYYYHIHGLL